MNLLDTVWPDAMPGIPRPIKHFCAITLSACLVFAATTPEPKPLGNLADLGGHRLHVNCTGNGSPTVIVENGLGDFSFDWILVQSRVSRFTRICTYDRAGYAWSGPGPKPRTFAQLNLELRDALSKLGEQGPFVLVGHSYGGPAVRNFATTYPHEVAGIVLVDSSFEGQRVGIGGKAMMRLGDGAKGRSIPPPSEDMKESDKPLVKGNATPHAQQPLDPMYNVLPPVQQKLQLWAQSLPEIEDAENSQREWSGEYFAKWLATSQAGKLGAIPLVVLTRAEGGYSDGDYDIPAAQLEKERNEGQAKLTLLSTNSNQVIVHSGHNMELEAPDEVTAAIRKVVEAVRRHGKL
jgi:pimeloyl-ACP methyl ester carboxylesterase